VIIIFITDGSCRRHGTVAMATVAV